MGKLGGSVRSYWVEQRGSEQERQSKTTDWVASNEVALSRWGVAAC